MMICGRCGEKLNNHDAVCPRCGAPAGGYRARHGAPAPSVGYSKSAVIITVASVVLTTLAVIAVLLVIFLDPAGYRTAEPEVTEIAETEAPTEAPFTISKSELEAEIEKIRTYYYTPGDEDRKVVMEKGADGWDYARDYRYHQNKPVFAFIFDGTEEHRLYFKDGHMIRYIDENHEIYDFPDTAGYSFWEEKALSEAYALVGEGERYMFVSEWLGKWVADNGENLEIYKVSDDDGLILTFNKMSEQGSMMSVEYEMEFDDEDRTVASEVGESEDHGGWEYTFVLSSRYITVKSRYPDQIFYKQDK